MYLLFYCGMDETRARATRVQARDLYFDNPSKPPLDRGGLGGARSYLIHITKKSEDKSSDFLRYGRDSNSRPPA